ncbi:MAG: hypothetical protein A2236_00655, partial [Bacteroidetes bacterium RIFOXYA2_FULL_33_7]
MFSKSIYFLIKGFFAFAITLFVYTNAYCQNIDNGIPLITNIPPKIYGFESQNYSIAQDKNGIIYIGNLSGVIEYDGTFWKLIKVTGIPILKTNNEGTIFVGAYNDFGYLDHDSLNQICFKSIRKNIKIKNFGAINKIEAIGNNVFFCSENSIFKYSISDKSIELINSSPNYINIFKANNDLLVYKYGFGLYKYIDNRFKLIPNSEYFKNEPIIDIISYRNSDLLIKTQNQKKLIRYNYNYIREFESDVDDFIAANEFVKGVQLSNGQIALATKRCGIAIIDQQGKLINIINTQNGLYNNNVNDLFIDKANNLWVALSNGLSIIETPSKISFFNETSGIQGGIYSMTKVNDILYVATSQGVFKYEGNAQNLSYNLCQPLRVFSPISNISCPCYSFYKINGRLYVTSDNGVYEITDNRAVLVFEGQLRSIHQLKKDSNIALFGIKDGLYIITVDENGVFRSSTKIDNFKEYARTFAEDDAGNIWFGSDYAGIYKMRLNENDISKPEIIKYNQQQGLPDNFGWIDVYSSSNGVLFSTYKGIYRFNYKTERFYIDTLIGFDFSTADRWVYPIVEDNNKNLWLSSGEHNKFMKHTGVAYFNKAKKKYNLDLIQFSKLSNYTIEAIYLDKDSVVWLGGFDGLIRFDKKINNETTHDFITLIRKIIIHKDSLISTTINKSLADVLSYNIDSVIVEIPYKYNSIRFEYSSPEYSADSKIGYEYILEGYDENYSVLKNSNVKEYTNLTEGDYTFKVRARDIYGNISKVAMYKFTIQPPLYRT